MSDGPLLIAVVGCDGSGKSTLTEALQQWLEARQPTVTCHLGKQSGNLGRMLARTPLMGRRIDRSIETRSRQAHKSANPGLLAALVIYAFALRRARRFRRMLKLRGEGYIIIADRFPQVELPSAIDGPGLGTARRRGLVGVLAAAEQRLFRHMVAHAPDLVLRLNVPLNLAAARKPDHRIETLARKIEEMPRLRFGAAPIVELDSREPLDRVVARAQVAVQTLLDQREPARPSAAA